MEVDFRGMLYQVKNTRMIRINSVNTCTRESDFHSILHYVKGFMNKDIALPKSEICLSATLWVIIVTFYN